MTPTEQRMFDLLLDLKFHTKEELHALLGDSWSGMNTVRAHLKNLRKHVFKLGWNIEYNRQENAYCLVQLKPLAKSRKPNEYSSGELHILKLRLRRRAIASGCDESILEYLTTLPGWDDQLMVVVRVDESRPFEPGNVQFEMSKTFTVARSNSI